MKPYRIFLMVGVVLLLAPRTPAADEPPAQPEARRVLVLDNESTLDGIIDRIGREYRVRGTAGETIVPGSKVLRMCESLEQAYEFLRSRANLRDPDERLRLARWCAKNDLSELAKKEAEETLLLRPKSAEAQQILKSLANLPDKAEPTRSSEPIPKTVTSKPVPEVAFSSETLQAFAQRIQPLLLNSCGACHNGGKTESLDLLRPPGPGQVTPALTRQNLARTLNLINREDPKGSPLLTKAVESHGGKPQPPLPSKESPTYRTLEAWVLKAVPPKNGAAWLAEPETKTTKPLAALASGIGFAEGSASHPDAAPAARNGFEKVQPDLLPSASGKSVTPSGTKPTGNADSEEEPMRLVPHEHRQVQSLLNAGQVVSGPQTQKKPPKLVTPVDPFDPIIFNQQFHPQSPGR